ncbi:retrovirus-related pol polyprotein from transposon TNT 1-94 [Tanacetum coccineum]
MISPSKIIFSRWQREAYFCINVDLQAKDTTIKKLKAQIKRVNETSTSKSVKEDLDEIETINIELEYRLDPVILAPKVKNNKEAYEYYLKHTMEQVAILRELVEQAKSRNPLDSATYSACIYVKQIQELLGYVRDIYPDIHKPSEKLVAVTPINKKNTVRFANIVASSSIMPKNSDSKNICNEHVKHPVKGAQALCSVCNECLFDANHDMCLIDHVNSMNVCDKSASKNNKKRKEWKHTGKVITATNKVPLRVPIPLKVVAPEHVVTRIYTRRPKVPKFVPNSKPKVVQIVMWYLDSGCSKHMTEDRSQLTNFVHKFLGTIKFGNDQVAKIMGYGDYHIGNVTISRVYYVEVLGHNLFSVGQFCDSDLEVAFRKHTCLVCNLEGVDLLSGSRGTNLYSLSIRDIMASSPICLLLKATKTKSWLWHRRLSHLNFSALNHLARNGLVRDLPRLKFENDHLCSACDTGKSKKQSHKPKSEDTNKKNYIFCTWIFVKFLASNNEAPNFIIKFLKMIQVRLNAAVRNIRTDNEIKFVNQTLRDYYEQLTAMAFEHSSLEPTLHKMTPVTLSSGLVPNLPPSAPFVPPSRHEWDLVL